MSQITKISFFIHNPRIMEDRKLEDNANDRQGCFFLMSIIGY